MHGVPVSFGPDQTRPRFLDHTERTTRKPPAPLLFHARAKTGAAPGDGEASNARRSISRTARTESPRMAATSCCVRRPAAASPLPRRTRTVGFLMPPSDAALRWRASVSHRFAKASLRAFQQGWRVGFGRLEMRGQIPRHRLIPTERPPFPRPAHQRPRRDAHGGDFARQIADRYGDQPRPALVCLTRKLKSTSLTRRSAQHALGSAVLA